MHRIENYDMNYKTDKQIEKEREAQVILALAGKAKANAPKDMSQAGIIRAVIREGGDRIQHNSFSSVRSVLIKRNFKW